MTSTMKLLPSDDPLLSEVMPEFDFENPAYDPKELEKDLVTTMAKNNGIGLAAPQVGIKTRVFSIFCQNIAGVKTPFAVFNPTIVAVSDDMDLSDEGCLTYPNLWLKVKRPSKVLGEFYDRDGNKMSVTFEGIDARCFQHELDHLNGLCYTSRVSKFKLDRAITKQRKQNGRTK